MLSPLLELYIGTSISFLMKLLKLKIFLIGDVSKDGILLLHSLHLFFRYWRVDHSLFIGQYMCPAASSIVLADRYRESLELEFLVTVRRAHSSCCATLFWKRSDLGLFVVAT